MRKMKRTDRRKAYMKRVADLTRETIEQAEQVRVDPGAGILDYDHIVSKQFGFKWGIAEERIASRENLQIMGRNANIEKGTTLTERGAENLRKWGHADLAEFYEWRKGR